MSLNSKTRTTAWFSSVAFALISTSALGGVGVPAPGLSSPHETAPANRIVPPATPRHTSPPLPPELLRRGPYQSVQVNVDENGDNIVGDAANEPTIAVDPTNHNRLVIGWREFSTVASDFRQAGWAYSRNAGRSWTFPGVIDPGVFRSDPVLEADSAGILYYNSLTTSGSDYYCKVFRSFDAGQTWDAGVDAYGGDKQWMVIDRTGGMGAGHIYAAWNRSFSSTYPYFFTRSIDGGASFQYPIGVPGNPYWGTLEVDSDGRLFICGAGFVVARSSDAQDPAATPTWDVSTTVALGGSIVYGAAVNPAGLAGQAWICTAPADPDSVYLLCSVDPSGSDPLDVRFARSTDGGQSWSTSVRVNDDSGTTAYQWFGTMSVAPNGRIDAVWNDTRQGPTYEWSALYYSYSTDGGVTWSANEPLTPKWNSLIGWPGSPPQQKIGDYYQMRSDNVGADLAYAATFNGEQDVYYLRIGDFDCNGNGVGDATDIAAGTSSDLNQNGIPDECEGLGDLNCDGALNAFDIDPFVLALTDPSAYAGLYPNCDVNRADINGDGSVNAFDIDPFVLLLTGGSRTAR
jgi:hypothetical protein